MSKHLFKNNVGFTLIELIIVIAIIGLLAAAAFVAIDPAKRIGAANDAQRWEDVTAITEAYLKHVVDNNGTHPTTTAEAGIYYAIMASSTVGMSSYDCQNITEDDTMGVQLEILIPTYLPTMPVDPSGIANAGKNTGYYFMKSSGGRIIIGACAESDYATASIYVQR
ncbi:prepilin-type N-terminal cleavage/methylation domain-containing protein [bacterium]|jgi:prepilin-type N-terminal cleavage/methylation domain-containing protein|nr:prepilin-type N-terminal cleavage/methylation domain-containing protein [bacterium]MBT4649433.1 prepilin-type N-terminal cleavage/methylation domain-containing protein [bacterium]